MDPSGRARSTSGVQGRTRNVPSGTLRRVGFETERERLLQAAVDVVVARGLGVSNRELAAELGTSHRMLDYYFGGRTELVDAVLDRLSARLQGLLAATPAGPEGAVSPASLASIRDEASPIAAVWLEVLLRAKRGEPNYAQTAQRVGQAWNDWLTTTMSIDAPTADALMAVVEGAGILEIIRGPSAAASALERLMALVVEVASNRRESP